MTITRAEATTLLGLLALYETPAHASHQCSVQLQAIEPYTDGELSRIRHLLRALARAEEGNPDRVAHWRAQLARIACQLVNCHRPLSIRGDPTMTVKFFPNDKGIPSGKLADAELHFGGTHVGPLDGLKLIGFAVWERKTGGRNVTFPARQYTVNGERRSFALLRPMDDPHAQEQLRDVILAAYAEFEESDAQDLASRDTGVMAGR